ncbi:hypothetical protein I317_00388 [Kwoniella heveanensis CBS 569]|nr:hypothetical protein I317_00388 [Kwoniella heveanensis CBS 569]
MIIPPTPAPAHAEGSIYRLKRGTKLSELPPLPPNPPIPDLSTLNGPFQLAEYLSLKVRADPHDVRGLVDVPSGDKSVGGKGPDKDVWIYEHMRRIPIDLTPLVTALLPICNPTTCPEMKAGEWLYLCSAHGGGAEQCSAIDYILHTLESTTGILNDPHNFPSRMQIPQASISRFPSLFRRLSRIFSHAYYHHRETFSLAEAETSLYARFLGLCEKYDLVGANLLPIPRSAIVGAREPEDDEDEAHRRNVDEGEGSSEEEEEAEDEEDEEEEEDQDPRGRGESGSIERRTQSLDRSLHPSTAESGPARSPSKLPAASSISSPTENDGTASPQKDILVKGKNIGRGTLGRGKQPRATMEWAEPPSQEPMPPIPSSAANTPASTSKSPIKGRDRSESIESAIHIPSLEPSPEVVQDSSLEELEAEVPEASSSGDVNATTAGEEANAATTDDELNEGEEEVVPKDEIELLEEEGKLKPQATVAPLAPPAEGEPAPASLSTLASETEVQANVNTSESSSENNDDIGADQDGKEDMQEIALNEPTPSTSVPEAEEPKIEAASTEMTSSSRSSLSKMEKKEKKLSPLRDKSSGSPAPSPIKGKGKPSAAEVVKSDSTTNTTTATTSSEAAGGDTPTGTVVTAPREEGSAVNDVKEIK